MGGLQIVVMSRVIFIDLSVYRSRLKNLSKGGKKSLVENVEIGRVYLIKFIKVNAITIVLAFISRALF